MSRKLHLVHIYPQEMNIYGDTGNRIILEKRLAWRGIDHQVTLVGVGDKLPLDTDIILGGGGQDAGQELVESDLLKRAKTLKSMASDGVVMLMICGMYQLLGDAFITNEDRTIKGAGVLPLFTQAGVKRFIGNTVIETSFGELIGYENHSGRTYLEDGCLPLGKVVKGAGNNGEDGTEGVVMNNIFGSYLHGPLLTKNPHFADELLLRALKRHGVENLTPLDDGLENKAHSIAVSRPR